MSSPQVEDWGQRGANSFLVSLGAGAVAGLTVEVVLYPLDCLKTRVQSRSGLQGVGPLRSLYRGCGTAIAGSMPASAIFFSTYECAKHRLAPDTAADGLPMEWGCTYAIICASVLGELAACCVRVPVDLVKQRLQAGYSSSFVLPMSGSIFLASFQATAMRDVIHSSLQYPIYEYLKSTLLRCNGRCHYDSLPAWQAAMCGSVAGIISATLTTPFDVLKTRLNLRPPPTELHGGPTISVSASFIADELGQIHRTKGVQGLFAGAGLRAAWMGLGGFVFLGSFELAKGYLTGVALTPHAPARQQQHAQPACPPPSSSSTSLATSASNENAGEAPTPFQSFSAGLIAGIAVDLPLHPVDTLKTRLQAREGLAASGGYRGLWNGLTAVLAMSVPASAVFFLVYDQVRNLCPSGEEQRPRLQSMAVDAVAASVADIAATVVRVPCEVVKQRMQCSQDGKLVSVTGSLRHGEGFRGLFAGFGAMVSRDVPFALLQMPLFEELKTLHPWTSQARATQSTSLQGLVGMSSGALAGAVSGFLTTPLDAAKTRIMTTVRREERRGLLDTMQALHAESGVRGLFRGVVPRTIHCGIGGALWLGAFEWSSSCMR